MEIVMDAALKSKWTAALRSGEYTQGQGTLKDRVDAVGTCQYCCLGVLTHLVALEGSVIDGIVIDEADDDIVIKRLEGGGFFEPFDAELPDMVLKFVGVSKAQQDHLIRMNDGDEDREIDTHTFSEIADWIDENL